MQVSAHSSPEASAALCLTFHFHSTYDTDFTNKKTASHEFFPRSVGKVSFPVVSATHCLYRFAQIADTWDMRENDKAPYHNAVATALYFCVEDPHRTVLCLGHMCAIMNGADFLMLKEAKYVSRIEAFVPTLKQYIPQPPRPYHIESFKATNLLIRLLELRRVLELHASHHIRMSFSGTLTIDETISQDLFDRSIPMFLVPVSALQITGHWWSNEDRESSDELIRNVDVCGETLTELSVYRATALRTEGLAKATNLTRLEVCKNKYITTVNMCGETLTDLNPTCFSGFTQEGLSKATRLTRLNARESENITSVNMCGYTLTDLDASDSRSTGRACGITQEGVSKATRLTRLDASNNRAITSVDMCGETLTELDARGSCGITQDALCRATRLTRLNASNNKMITSVDMCGETLTELDASLYWCGITQEGLCKATRLTKLGGQYNPKITSVDMCGETLTELDARGGCGITTKGLSKATRLTKLVSADNNKIRNMVQHATNSCDLLPPDKCDFILRGQCIAKSDSLELLKSLPIASFNQFDVVETPFGLGVVLGYYPDKLYLSVCGVIRLVEATSHLLLKAGLKKVTYVKRDAVSRRRSKVLWEKLENVKHVSVRMEGVRLEVSQGVFISLSKLPTQLDTQRFDIVETPFGIGVVLGCFLGVIGGVFSHSLYVHIDGVIYFLRQCASHRFLTKASLSRYSQEKKMFIAEDDSAMEKAQNLVESPTMVKKDACMVFAKKCKDVLNVIHDCQRRLEFIESVPTLTIRSVWDASAALDHANEAVSKAPNGFRDYARKSRDEIRKKFCESGKRFMSVDLSTVDALDALASQLTGYADESEIDIHYTSGENGPGNGMLLRWLSDFQETLDDLDKVATKSHPCHALGRECSGLYGKMSSAFGGSGVKASDIQDQLDVLFDRILEEDTFEEEEWGKRHKDLQIRISSAVRGVLEEIGNYKEGVRQLEKHKAEVQLAVEREEKYLDSEESVNNIVQNATLLHDAFWVASDTVDDEESAMKKRMKRPKHSETTEQKEKYARMCRQLAVVEREWSYCRMENTRIALSFLPELYHSHKDILLSSDYSEFGDLFSETLKLSMFTDIQKIESVASRHTVYSAYMVEGNDDNHTNPQTRQYALKEFNVLDESGKKRFLREVRALQKVGKICSGVVQVLHVFMDGLNNGNMYLMMPFYACGNMSQYIQKRRNESKLLTTLEAWKICKRLISALRMLHTVSKVIHCDVKPDNIFITSEGEAVIGDFDVSVDAEQRAGMTQTMLATREFAAPEVLMGERPSFASDVFSLGKVFEYIVKNTELPTEMSDLSALSDLASQMTRHNAKERVDLDEVLEDDYFSYLSSEGYVQQERAALRRPHWNNPESNGSLVDVTQEMQAAMQDMVNKTCIAKEMGKGRDSRGLKHKGLFVEKVERLEHAELWNEYAIRRHNISKDIRYDSRVSVKATLRTTRHGELYDNEHYLFHGTKPDIVPIIVKHGMDPAVCSVSGLFGGGVYFAENSSKADEYLIPDPKDGLCRLFVCRVALGNPYITRRLLSHIRRPPDLPGGSGACFDSVVADTDHYLQRYHREFIVYRANQSYPEYLVHIRRVSAENPGNTACNASV